MKKICHLTSAHESNDDRIFQKECASLARAGYDTYLVARGESREEKGVHVVGLGEAPTSRLKRMISFAKKVYMKALEIDADIYHLHDPELLPWGVKLKKSGKKVIFDSHENTLEQMEEKYWIPPFLRKPVSTVYKQYAKIQFKVFDCLVSVTPHIIRQLKEINSNVWMVTNYPIISDSKPPEKAQHDSVNICFTGGISEQWGHLHIVECLKDVENVTYILCGPVGSLYLQKLQQLQGWEKVDYRGLLPYEQAREIQRQSDVGIALLLPNRNTNGREGTIGNIKLFEYMMAGLPVICTEFDLWRDIIDKYNCGIYIDPTDKAALINAIEFIRSNPDDAKQMGLNGRRAVEQEFNWGTQEKTLLELYERI